MSERPNVVYGRLLEAAHFTGYGFERVCSELEWLLDEGRWREVGNGYEDVREFMASIDTGGMSIDQRKEIARKLNRELNLSLRQAAQAAGIATSTLHYELEGRSHVNTPTTDSSDADTSERSHVNTPAWLEATPEKVRAAATDRMRRDQVLEYMGSSASDDWPTPQDLFDVLDAEFGFELDVCALPTSAKCARYFTPADDGLSQEWEGICWMNPPYGLTIGDWIAKAAAASENGATVVCLLPARVDTAWWHVYCANAEIRFLRGRVTFGNSTSPAPFPSAVVIFGRPPNTHNAHWDWQ